MIGALLGGLASGVGGALVSKIGGSGGNGNPSSPAASNSLGGTLRNGFGHFADLGAGFGEALTSAMDSRVEDAFLKDMPNAVMSKIFGKGKDKLGEARDRGAALREMLNAAYPGTSAWDQLGASGGGAAAVSGAANDLEREKMALQERIADKQFANQKDIARIQAAAQLGAANVPYDHPEAKLNFVAERALKNSQEKYNWSATTLNRAKDMLTQAQTFYTQQQTEESIARTNTEYTKAAWNQAQTALARVQAEWFPKSAQADITAKETNSILTTMFNTFKAEGKDPWQSFSAILDAVGAAGLIFGAGRAVGGLANIRRSAYQGSAAKSQAKRTDTGTQQVRNADMKRTFGQVKVAPIYQGGGASAASAAALKARGINKMKQGQFWEGWRDLKQWAKDTSRKNNVHARAAAEKAQEFPVP